MPDPDECSLEVNEEEGDTQSYFFLRYRDSVIVVYKVAGEDGKVTSVLQEVYHGEGSQEEPDEERWILEPEGVLKQILRVSSALTQGGEVHGPRNFRQSVPVDVDRESIRELLTP